MSDQAVVILDHRRDGERNSWVRLLSESQGLIQAKAYGAGRSKKRFAGGLSATMWGVAQLQQRAGKWHLNSLETDALHLRLGQSLQGFAAAAYACELCSALLAEQDGGGAVFSTLRELLSQLAQEAYPGGWLRYWELVLLSHQGWLSPPGRCHACEEQGKRSGDANFFVEATGQWRCAEHAPAYALELSKRCVAALASFDASWRERQAAPEWLGQGRYAALDSALRREIRAWCWKWTDRHLAYPLKSRAVLIEMGRGISSA